MNSEFPPSPRSPQSGTWVLGDGGKMLGSWPPTPSRLALAASVHIPMVSSHPSGNCSNLIGWFSHSDSPWATPHPLRDRETAVLVLLWTLGMWGLGGCLSHIWLPLLPFPVSLAPPERWAQVPLLSDPQTYMRILPATVAPPLSPTPGDWVKS